MVLVVVDADLVGQVLERTVYTFSDSFNHQAVDVVDIAEPSV